MSSPYLKKKFSAIRLVCKICILYAKKNFEEYNFYVLFFQTLSNLKKSSMMGWKRCLERMVRLAGV